MNFNYTLAAIFAVASVAGAQAAPAGWKVATDRRMNCEISVPSDWTPGQFNVGMKGPKGDVSIIVSSSAINDLAMAKEVTADIFKPVKTFEDSKTRYFIEYAPKNGRKGIYWYQAVLAKGMVCAMDLTADSNLSEADAKQIAQSLKAH